MARRRLDQYFTPEHATLTLLDRVPHIGGTILEPCAGTGEMAWPLSRHGADIWTNDIDEALGGTDWQTDATAPGFWQVMGDPVLSPGFDWVISNPPFSCCTPIIVGAFGVARKGVAMLLRLSWLEPCKDRAAFLGKHPPSLIVLPRISFTGDGKTDNVTCAWFVWDFSGQYHGVSVATKDEVKRIKDAHSVSRNDARRVRN